MDTLAVFGARCAVRGRTDERVSELDSIAYPEQSGIDSPGQLQPYQCPGFRRLRGGAWDSRAARHRRRGRAVACLRGSDM